MGIRKRQEGGEDESYRNEWSKREISDEKGSERENDGRGWKKRRRVERERVK